MPLPILVSVRLAQLVDRKRVGLRLRIILVAACFGAGVACGSSWSQSREGGYTHDLRTVASRFVPVPAAFVAQYRSTARTLGYPIPCPMRVPKGLDADNRGPRPGCKITIICPGLGSWHGWGVGSIAGFTIPPKAQDLVVTASPRLLLNDAKVVNGPFWYPAARVQPLASVTVNGWRMRAVFVAAASNHGSHFARHVVLIWTVGEHTYAIGFHDFTGIRPTLLLDETLAMHISLIGP